MTAVTYPRLKVVGPLPEGYDYPFREGEEVLSLGEIGNMPGHVAVVLKDGSIRWGYHDYWFEEPMEEAEAPRDCDQCLCASLMDCPEGSSRLISVGSINQTVGQCSACRLWICENCMFSHRECSWSTEPVDKTEFQNGSIYDRVRWSMSEARKAGDHRPGSEFFRPTVQALLWNTKRNLLDQEEWDVSIAGL